MRTRSSRAIGPLGFLLFSVFMNTVAGVMIVPMVPRLMTELGEKSAQAATERLGLFLAVFAFAQFVAAPVLGALSDRFGRRPIILLSSLGMAADFFVMALAPSFGWLVIGRFFGGVMAGGWAASLAYFSDITPEEHRTRRFGYVAAAASCGAMMAPVFGGLLAEVGTRAPFWIAGCVSLLAAGYAVVALPESLEPDRRRPLRFGDMNVVGVGRQLLGRYPRLVRILVTYAVLLFALVGSQSILAMYASLRFGWTPATLGLYAASLSLVGIVVQGVLVGRVVRHLGEPRTILAGLTLQIAGLSGIAFARTGEELWLSAVVLVFGGMATPALNAIANHQVPASDRGRLAGASASLASMIQIAAPPLFAGLLSFSYGRTSAFAAGSPFGAGAALVAIALVCALTFLRPRRGEEAFDLRERKRA